MAEILKGQAVWVQWQDACDHGDNWVAMEDAAEFGTHPCLIVSLGFLVSRTDKYVTLAADWDAEDQNFGRVTKIPTAMITTITPLDTPPLVGV